MTEKHVFARHGGQLKYIAVFCQMLLLIALCYNILVMRMAEITSIPPFDPFEQTGSVGPRWDRWKI